MLGLSQGPKHFASVEYIYVCSSARATIQWGFINGLGWSAISTSIELIFMGCCRLSLACRKWVDMWRTSVIVLNCLWVHTISYDWLELACIRSREVLVATSLQGITGSSRGWDVLTKSQKGHYFKIRCMNLKPSLNSPKNFKFGNQTCS